MKPLAEQGEWESRRFWQNVANGIRGGNFDLAGKEKSRIEVGDESPCMSSFLIWRSASDSSQVFFAVRIPVSTLTLYIRFTSPSLSLQLICLLLLSISRSGLRPFQNRTFSPCDPFAILICSLTDTSQNDQRQRRKDEQAAGTPWQLVNFTHVDEDVEYQQLVEMLHDKYQPAHEDGYIFKGQA